MNFFVLAPTDIETTLSVKDEKGNLFDFNNQPLEFEVEIN